MKPGHVRRTRRRNALRLGVVPLLFALVGIPLMAVGGLIVQDLNEADQQRSTVTEMVPVAETRLDAIELRAALSDERTWSIADLGVEQYGVDPADIIEIIGVDVQVRYSQARTTTDGLAVDWPFVEESLAELRADRKDSLTVADDYLSVMEHVDATGRDAAARLQELAVAVPDGEGVLRALAVTEAIADAQLSVNGQFVSSIAARFVQSTGEPEQELQSLVEHRRAYTIATTFLDETIADASLAGQYRTVTEATSENTMLRLVDEQIAEALEFGLAPVDGDIFETAIANLTTLEPFLLSSENSNRAWIDLSQSSGENLITIARQREVASSSQISDSRLLLVATGLVTLIATVLVALLFSRSVRLLAKAAQSLRDGETGSFEPSGPREVYVAGVALSEATSNFNLLRRQATVLAEGELNHPDLEKTAPGQLGATLKRVIDTLSHSIHERKRAQDEVLWEASHDGLTGLLNRSASMEHIESLLDADAEDTFAVLVVDLDGFKAINDSHGHPTGDEVLVEIAHRLQRHCREADEVCRLGGDEFVMVLAGPDPEIVAHDIATRTLDALSETIELSSGALIRMSACIGIAISKQTSTVSGLLKNADLAVYEAKANGRSAIVTCTSDLLAESRRTAQLTADILDAIDDDELRLEYQPIVDPTGQIFAVEALIRWDHPVHGLIMPEHFISIAERSDLIIAIDRWVVRNAVQQLATWTDENEDMSELVVAVNVSTRHLNAHTAAADILGPLEAYGIDPRRLSVEITETALIQDTEEVRTNLEALRAGGISIAVDDFGTGHSSITQLRVLPIDVIKIDRSFTAQVTSIGSFDSALVQMIIDTAHLLGAEIVTEGVESIEQAEAAIRMGTDALQGWLFSPSVRAEEVPELLARHRLDASRLTFRL